jgi:hypothetical protein
LEGEMDSIINQIFLWPAIIQGALGSALFWVIQELLIFLGRNYFRRFKGFNNNYIKDALIRELVYRKYSSRSGLVNYTQGFIITFEHVFKYLITALIFIVISLFILGSNKLILGISLVGSLYYLLKALQWVSPSKKWLHDTNLQTWKRIGEIETQLFGSVDDDTKDWIEHFSQENDSDNQK